MTEPFDEYGDRLRRALHAEADAVTPSPEGLERIRTKINKRRERHLGLWFPSPWLRPIAAVAAAIIVSIIAVSATPALKNFVQTGHFSPDTQSGGGPTSTNDGRSQGQMPPPATPAPSVSPRNPIPPPSSGKHVVTAPCPPGEGTFTPPNGGTPALQGSGPAPKVTCQPDTGGDDQTTAPPTDGATSPPPSSPQQPPPASDTPPPQGSQPSAQVQSSP
jgi:hypothetical protein